MSEQYENTDNYTEQDLDVLYKELKKFNWGAFGLTVIWALCNGVNGEFWRYFGIIVLLFVLGFLFGAPAMGLAVLVTFGISIYIGFKGNEWAWSGTKNWGSIDNFNKYQKKWVIGWIISFVFWWFVLPRIMVGMMFSVAKDKLVPVNHVERTVKEMVKTSEYKNTMKTGEDFAKYYLKQTFDGCEDGTSTILEDGVTVSCKSAIESDVNILVSFTKYEGGCSLANANCLVTISIKDKDSATTIRKVYFGDNGKIRAHYVK